MVWTCSLATAFVVGDTSFGSGTQTGGRTGAAPVSVGAVPAAAEADGVVDVGEDEEGDVEIGSFGAETEDVDGVVGTPVHPAVATTAPMSRTCRRAKTVVT